MIDQQSPRRIQAPPRAGAMIEALRGLGYDTSTALADILDNSIAAGARCIWIDFEWAGLASRVLVRDDGAGMSPDELERAMRLGERDPLAPRRPDDLGRFGLGLKTASFSQCRRLTVVSRRDDVTSCLRWDLDEIVANGGTDWELLEGPATGSDELPGLLPADRSGTLVAWEVLDRLVTPGFTEKDLLNQIDRVERRLSMVFHRYIEDPARLRILVNGREMSPWDPFLEGHRDTWSSPEERIVTSVGQVVVRGHVLPHRDRLSAAEHDLAAGPDGWTAQQGFYVYRQERLLLGGSWLNLGQRRRWMKEEPHRLARIRVDIGNSGDEAWRIDVRKSTARPPVEVRHRLVALAEDTRERARRVFAWRGRLLSRRTTEPVAQAWISRSTTGGLRYAVSEQHPAVTAVLDQAGPLLPQVRAMLRVIAETVPVQRIWLDTAENRETPRTGFVEAPPAELLQVLDVMYRNLVERRGMSPEAARQRLLATEPFDAHPAVVAALPDVPAAITRS